ncbi:MAG: hypothetical protein BGO49_17295 [Planctomycetales bacterium 71-10]|nr:MAG: hypothetical protein BGO49_17295 [Planctomycetales bacterium 71-10]
MPYTAEISRTNPSCFLFLIDQSGSMQDVMDPTNLRAMDSPMVVDGRTYTHTASGKTKAQGVADAINRLLQNLVIKCAKSEGVRDYYEVGVIGYGGDNTAYKVGPAFSGALVGREVVPIGEIADSPARIEERSKKVDDGAGGLVDQKIKFPIWFDPVAVGGTPMSQAMTKARDVLSDWVARHPASFPPIVINITDGEWTDSDPTPAAESVKALSTDDGNVLVFNIHISANQGASIEFPDDESRLGDQYARFLFNLSSPLPSYMQSIARQEGLQVSELSRGFAFNADMVGLIRFIDIGTRPSNLR